MSDFLEIVSGVLKDVQNQERHASFSIGELEDLYAELSAAQFTIHEALITRRQKNLIAASHEYAEICKNFGRTYGFSLLEEKARRKASGQRSTAEGRKLTAAKKEVESSSLDDLFADEAESEHARLQSFIERVDKACCRLYGLTVHDLPDYDFGSAWARRENPEATAKKVMSASRGF